MTERTFTEAEVAELLGISIRTLQRWRKSGVCPIKPLPGLGRTIRYAFAELHRYFNREQSR